MTDTLLPKNDEELREEIYLAQSEPIPHETHGPYCDQYEMCKKCKKYVDNVMQLIKARDTKMLEQARIDEHKILNARFCTVRSSVPELKKEVEEYNLCRQEWSRISHERINELSATKEKL